MYINRINEVQRDPTRLFAMLFFGKSGEGSRQDRQSTKRMAGTYNSARFRTKQIANLELHSAQVDDLELFVLHRFSQKVQA